METTWVRQTPTTEGERPSVPTADDRQRVLDVLQVLLKTLQSKASGDARTYLSDSVLLMARMTKVLDELGPVQVTVTDTGLSVQGEPWPEAPSALRDLLVRDGIEAMQLQPGLSRAEMTAWVHAAVLPTAEISQEGGWSRILARSSVTHLVVTESRTRPPTSGRLPAPRRTPTAGKLPPVPESAPKRPPTAGKLPPTTDAAPRRPPTAGKLPSPDAPKRPPTAGKLPSPDAPKRPPTAGKLPSPDAPKRPPTAGKLPSPDAPKRPPTAGKLPPAARRANPSVQLPPPPEGYSDEWLLETLRLLVRAVKSKDSFGGQGHMAAMALSSLNARLLPYLHATGALSLTWRRDSFVIKGRSLPPAQAPSELTTLLERQRLAGFEIGPEVSKEELSKWLGLLARGPEAVQQEGGWKAAMTAAGITQISVVTPEGAAATPPAAAPATPPPAAAPRPVAAAAAAVAPTAPSALGQLTSVLDALQSGTPSETVVRELAAIRELLESNGHRATPTVSGDGAEVQEMVRTVLHRAHPKEVTRLLGLARSALPLDDYLKRDAGVLLQSLEGNDDPDHDTATVAALMGLGQQAIPTVVRYLGTSDNVRARTVAMFALSKIVPDTDILLTRRLVESPSPEETGRLLDTMESARIPWSSSLNMLLHHPSGFVRRRAYAFFIRSAGIVKQEKLNIITETLLSEQAWLVADAARAAGILREMQMGPTVAALLKRNFETPGDTLRVHKEACFALGRIRYTDAFQTLKGIVYPSLTSRLVGMTQQLAQEREELRGAALWAISRFPGPQFQEVVEKAASGNDMALRSMAQVAMDTRKSYTVEGDVLALMEM